MVVSARLDRRIPGGVDRHWSARTALVGALDLQAHGVAVLGTIATGAPHVGLTGLSVVDAAAAWRRWPPWWRSSW